MGSKGSDPVAAPPPLPEQDNSYMFEMMNAMMGMMGQQAPAVPAIPATPTPYEAPEIDWTEKHKKLAAKAKADYNVSRNKKKGRTDTILTSPLLDEEDPLTSKSLLTPVPST